MLETGGIAGLAAAEGAGNLLGYRLVLAELGQQRLVQQVLYVLCVVEGGGGRRALGNLFLITGLARVDSLKNAEATKVGQRDLQLLDSTGAGDVVFGGASGAYSSGGLAQRKYGCG